MKKHFKLRLLPLVILGFCTIAMINAGCKKPDSETKFGYTYIYIPQSTVSDGQNNFYPVPTGIDSLTYNYSVDTTKKIVNVFLGVTRSGLQAANGYSVSLSTNADTVNSLIGQVLALNTDSTVTSATLLPDSAYSLPKTVIVPSGSNATNFNLVINEQILKTYANQIVVLYVSLSNPSQYMLSPTNSQVIITIDVNKLHLP